MASFYARRDGVVAPFGVCHIVTGHGFRDAGQGAGLPQTPQRVHDGIRVPGRSGVRLPRIEAGPTTAPCRRSSRSSRPWPSSARALEIPSYPADSGLTNLECAPLAELDQLEPKSSEFTAAQVPECISDAT